MNLKFKHVTAKNFLSFKELDFDISRFDGKTVLITGYNDDIQGESSKQNGAGKSTLNNTILFAIYGEVLNPLKKATSIRNWSPSVSQKDDVEVVLTIENDGKEYTIQRLLKGKKCSGELHVFSREIGSEEWNEITLSTMVETQRLIETDIVPCGKEGFLRCVILTADQNYNFFKLNKAAKNSFFESLFELTKYSDMYSKLHRMTLDENSSLTASSKSIDKFNLSIAKLEEDREKSKKNQSDIIKSEKDVENAKREIDKFKASGISEKIDGKKKEYEIFKENRIREIKDEISKFDFENKIKKTDSKHRIIFDSATDSEFIEDKTRAYDEENGIKLDSSGNIVFDVHDGYDETNEIIKTLTERKNKGGEMIKSLRNEISSVSKRITSIESEYSAVIEKIRNMRSTLSAHSKITDILCSDCVVKYMDSVDISDYPNEIEKMEKSIKPLEEKKRAEESIKSENEKTLEKYENGISKIESEISENNDKLNAIKARRSEIQNNRNNFIRTLKKNISMEHDSLQLKRDQFRSSMASGYKDECASFERDIQKMKMEFENKSIELESNLKNAEYRLKIVSEGKTEGFDASIRSIEESLENEKKEFDRLTETICHYKALEEILKPENIRKSVVPDMLKELNFRICGYLSKMGSNYTCSFDNDFEATFVSNSGAEAEYNNFSSGEKMRLSIACCLAFRDFMQVRLNFHPNMLMIDEFIDSNLDAMAVGGIMDMIHYMVGTEKISAFIISHRSEIKQDSFDSEILIRKKNDESKIIIDGIET